MYMCNTYLIYMLPFTCTYYTLLCVCRYGRLPKTGTVMHVIRKIVEKISFCNEDKNCWTKEKKKACIVCRCSNFTDKN